MASPSLLHPDTQHFFSDLASPSGPSQDSQGPHQSPKATLKLRGRTVRALQGAASSRLLCLLKTLRDGTGQHLLCPWPNNPAWWGLGGEGPSIDCSGNVGSSSHSSPVPGRSSQAEITLAPGQSPSPATHMPPQAQQDETSECCSLSATVISHSATARIELVGALADVSHQEA